MSLNAVASRVSLPWEGREDYFKGQNSFSQYYSGWGFYGSLLTVSTKTMYKVKKAAGATLAVNGVPLALPLHMTFTAGWNYVPCPYQQTTSLTRAFPFSGPSSLSYTTADLLKSQVTFATFYEGYGWFGNLKGISPGAGYKLRLERGGRAAFPRVE